MKYTLFKPNSKNSGALASFQVSVDESAVPALWVNIVKQFSWSNGKGSFSQNAKNPEKMINVKFSLQEISGIIQAIEEKGKFSAFHSSSGGETRINFDYSTTGSGDKIREGYFFSVTKDGNNKFFLPLSRNTEAYGLAKFLTAAAFTAPCVAQILADGGVKPSRPQQVKTQASTPAAEQAQDSPVVEKKKEENPFTGGEDSPF